MAINKTFRLTITFVGAIMVDGRKENYMYIFNTSSVGNNNSHQGSVQINPDSDFELHQIMANGQYPGVQNSYSWYNYPMSNYGIQLIDQASGSELLKDASVTVANRVGVPLDDVAGITGATFLLDAPVVLLANTALQLFLVQQQNSLF